MSWFTKKPTPLNSDEFEKLRTKISEVRLDLSDLDARERKHYDELQALRGKFYKNKQLETQESEDLKDPFAALRE